MFLRTAGEPKDLRSKLSAWTVASGADAPVCIFIVLNAKSKKMVWSIWSIWSIWSVCLIVWLSDCLFPVIRSEVEKVDEGLWICCMYAIESISGYGDMIISKSNTNEMKNEKCMKIRCPHWVNEAVWIKLKIKKFQWDEMRVKQGDMMRGKGVRGSWCRGPLCMSLSLVKYVPGGPSFAVKLWNPRWARSSRRYVNSWGDWNRRIWWWMLSERRLRLACWTPLRRRFPRLEAMLKIECLRYPFWKHYGQSSDQSQISLSLPSDL